MTTCSNADPASRRDRCRGVPSAIDGAVDGAAAAAAPSNSSRWWGVTTTAGAGESPAPGTSNNVTTAAADSAAPSAATYAGEAMTAWASTPLKVRLVRADVNRRIRAAVGDFELVEDSETTEDNR